MLVVYIKNELLTPLTNLLHPSCSSPSYMMASTSFHVFGVKTARLPWFRTWLHRACLLISEQVQLAPPLKCAPNATTPFCLHFSLPAPATNTSYLDSIPNWSFCPCLCPRQSFPNRVSRVVILKHSQITSLLYSKAFDCLTISSQFKSEPLTIAYKALQHLVLVPLWSHFLFLLPSCAPLWLLRLPCHLSGTPDMLPPGICLRLCLERLTLVCARGSLSSFLQVFTQISPSC